MTTPFAMKDLTAIAGVARTKVDRSPQTDSMTHIARAVKAAVEDAALCPDDIDGLMVGTGPEEASMDKLPEMLGLRHVRWSFQGWAHGRMQSTCIAIAAWAVLAGQANYVACVASGQRLASHRARFTGAGAYGNVESHREGGGPHLESPPYGLISVGGGAAMAMRRYFEKYGGTEEMLGAVAVAQRQWAQMNPDAYFCGEPLTLERYIAEPYVVEPLRTFDHCIPANAGFCIIVTTAERARDCRYAPIYLSGIQGSRSGRDSFIFARSGLGIGQQTEKRYVAPRMPIYEMAGVSPSDVQILGALDAFSPVVLFILEEYGFCKEGEALSFVQEGRTAPGGVLAVNTCGGGLSDMESYGWGHEIEMVKQMRGQAGAAQLPDVRVCQYASLDHSSLILTRQ